MINFINESSLRTLNFELCQCFIIHLNHKIKIKVWFIESNSLPDIGHDIDNIVYLLMINAYTLYKNITDESKYLLINLLCLIFNL